MPLLATALLIGGHILFAAICIHGDAEQKRRAEAVEEKG